MSNVINLDPVKAEMIAILRQKIADVSSGDISGLMIISEYKDKHTLEMPGYFYSDEDSIARLVGRMQIVQHFLVGLTFQNGNNEDD